jgi:hypothetical protein
MRDCSSSRLPYHESDHVLNIAYNPLCDGNHLEDIEVRRNDVNFLDAIGARRVPDPTAAGDFCRRFTPADIEALQDVFNQVRQGVWQRQPHSFFDLATIDMDGSLVETTGNCARLAKRYSLGGFSIARLSLTVRLAGSPY